MCRIKSTQIETNYRIQVKLFFAFTQTHWALMFASFVASCNDFLRSDYEFVANYKLLQAAFTKNRVQRYVDVTKNITIFKKLQ